MPHACSVSSRVKWRELEVLVFQQVLVYVMSCDDGRSMRVEIVAVK